MCVSSVSSSHCQLVFWLFRSTIRTTVSVMFTVRWLWIPMRNLSALLDVNTLHWYSDNFIGYLYVSMFGTSWQPWHSDHIGSGAGVSYRRLSARCWIQTVDTQISGTIRLRHTTLQQHVRRQIIRSSRSACVERPSCYPSQHRADNGHFLQTSQNCFVYWFMRSRRIRDILILLN